MKPVFYNLRISYVFCTLTSVLSWDTRKAPWENCAIAGKFGRHVKSRPCTTDSCKAMAKKVTSSLDENTNPCEDFYQYACGNWIAANPIPDNQSSIDHFYLLSEKLKLIKQDMLETMKGKMFSAEVKAKSMYKQCTNRAQVERLRSRTFRDLLDGVMGGWPILREDWHAETFDLYEVLTRIRPYALQPFISVSTSPDLESPLENMIYIEQVGFYTSKDVLLSDAEKLVTDSYTDYMRTITSLLLQDAQDIRDESDPQIIDDLADILSLERYFIMNQLTSVEQRNYERYKNKLSLRSIQHTMHFKSTIFQNLTNLVKSTFTPVNLDDLISHSTKVVSAVTNYLAKVDEKLYELEQEGETGKRRLANFIGWQIFMAYQKRLEKYRDAYEVLQQKIYGRKQKQEKTVGELCASDVTVSLPLAVSAMYVRDYVPKDLKAKASMMVDDIKAAAEIILQSADWMDQHTTNNALIKVRNMIDLIAYADVLVKNLTAIDKEYEELVIMKTYFETLRELDKADSSKNLRLLTKPNVRNDPLTDADDITQINAYNNPVQNKIVVYAAILQLPFFDADSPQWANYGGIGYVLGHELTHSFDDQGSQFDSEGRMISWWTNETLAGFNIRKRDMVKEYNAYKFDVGSINGELTLGENIADNGGLKAAYKLHDNSLMTLMLLNPIFRATSCIKNVSLVPEPTLSGLEDFTVDQLFFLSAAQVWCKDWRPEKLRMDLLTDVHSPAKYRVIGPMSNMPEFSASFNCPSGSRMNPVKKVAVW
ncbi:LOW QUALITY PROTEIN: endothelin-converting enzyme homolog [Paramacrobiotus metropolitanus]|uniref:LOW QUALITY PROTEIN: endothelin-converting enzyme homolog n=1 Tax=Paramacrobiotus metropolitanus TaxID=2943436 RepID=UPI002445895B|nr:LOW QUALITY PROTEIN: endothelin-converting enzyme homolog [Paramacrobiotus metropolitanus]